MKINIKFLNLFVATIFLFLNSCETLDLDQTVNPSAISSDLLDPVYTFNYVQLQLPDFVNSANRFTQQVTRQMAMTGGTNYDNAFNPNSFDTNWSQGYNILNAVKIMEPKAIQNKEFYALGASKVIRCYVLLSMVDLYGDIPYTEALLGSNNFTPKFDSSASIYEGILIELDDAIVTLGETENSASIAKDLYYDSKAKWVTLAKTLKLKMYCTARLAGNDIGVADIGLAINSIISGGDYIDNASEDFAFKYGTTRNNPNSRHPLYNDQYEIGGGAYIGNYMMWTMTTEKGKTAGWKPNLQLNNLLTDPRTNYYFFKQKDPSSTSIDNFILPPASRSRPSHYDETRYKSFYDNTIKTCFSFSNWIEASTTPEYGGFWGRDHGNASGIPPDEDKRTNAGIYPIGGDFGYSKTCQNSGTDGALGAGIMPMILSSYVNFLIAESILTASVSGDARDQFKKGMEASIDKVINFKPDFQYKAASKPNPVNIAGQKDKYVTYMLGIYDVLDNTKKLELVVKEYYIASWGNGIEPYNNYRRTGFPSNFQPTLEPISGSYYYTALYPSASVNNNPNAPANLRTKKVFWDKANLDLK